MAEILRLLALFVLAVIGISLIFGLPDPWKWRFRIGLVLTWICMMFYGLIYGCMHPKHHHGEDSYDNGDVPEYGPR